MSRPKIRPSAPAEDSPEPAAATTDLAVPLVDDAPEAVAQTDQAAPAPAPEPEQPEPGPSLAPPAPPSVTPEQAERAALAEQLTAAMLALEAEPDAFAEEHRLKREREAAIDHRRDTLRAMDKSIAELDGRLQKAITQRQESLERARLLRVKIDRTTKKIEAIDSAGA